MAKSGRRVQANARTLSYAVRQYFRPVLREIQPTGSTSSTGSGHATTTLVEPIQASTSSPPPTPYDQLIPTQPEDVQSLPVSEKSLGKRKRVENEDAVKLHTNGGVQTRFTQADIPPALKKC